VAGILVKISEHSLMEWDQIPVALLKLHKTTQFFAAVIELNHLTV